MHLRAGYILKRAQQALKTRLDKTMRPLGLTTPQYAVLSAIDLERGISAAALARAAFVTAQTMQGIVTNLEREGFLKRNIDPSHGRILRSELTKRGRDVLKRAHMVANEIEASMTVSMTAEEQAHLSALLSRCVDNLAAADRVRVV